MYGSTSPARALYADPAGDPPGVSFVSVIFSDAGPPEDGPDEEGVCAHCFIDQAPELGRGLDLVLEVGGAVERDPESGEWRPTQDGNFYYEDL